MIIPIKDGDKTLIGGVWLIAGDKLTDCPVGTRYAVMSDDPGYFGGLWAVVVDTTIDLFVYGAANSDNKYPNGTPIYEVGNILNWQTVQEPSDPLPQATDAEIFKSALKRKIIPADTKKPVGL
jgi:hypothetical protein